MPRARSATRLGLRLLFAILLLVVAAGCSDDDGDAAAPVNPTGTSGPKPTVGAGDPSTTLSVYAPDQLQRALNELKAGYEYLSDYTMVITYGSQDDLIAGVEGGDRPNLLIAEGSRMDRLADDDLFTEAPSEFGTDQLLMLTKSGNPAGVPAKAAVFAENSKYVTGLCATEVPCGAAAQTVLEDAGVTPVADTVEPTGRSLVDKLAKGKVDVALAFRTDYMNRFFKTEPLPFPDFPPYIITYDIGTLEASDPTAAFLTFLGSDAGRSILMKRGLLPLGSV